MKQIFLFITILLMLLSQGCGQPPSPAFSRINDMNAPYVNKHFTILPPLSKEGGIWIFADNYSTKYFLFDVLEGETRRSWVSYQVDIYYQSTESDRGINAIKNKDAQYLVDISKYYQNLEYIKYSSINGYPAIEVCRNADRNEPNTIFKEKRYKFYIRTKTGKVKQITLTYLSILRKKLPSELQQYHYGFEDLERLVQKSLQSFTITDEDI